MRTGKDGEDRIRNGREVKRKGRKSVRKEKWKNNIGKGRKEQLPTEKNGEDER